MSWLNKVNQEKVLCLYTVHDFIFLSFLLLQLTIACYYIASEKPFFLDGIYWETCSIKISWHFFSASFPYWKRKGKIELIGKKVLIYLNWALAQFMCSVYNLNQSGYCLSALFQYQVLRCENIFYCWNNLCFRKTCLSQIRKLEKSSERVWYNCY